MHPIYRGAFFHFWRNAADQAFVHSQKLLADAQQKLDSAKALADVGLENQAKELLAQEREKRAVAIGAGLGGQTVVQTEDQAAALPGNMPFENVSIESNTAENATAPLAPKDGNGIINEGTQGENRDGDAGGVNGQKTIGIGRIAIQSENFLR